MKKIYLGLIITFLFVNSFFAQLQNANWYFGEHIGMNFVQNISFDYNGNYISPINKTATVSDDNGNLLFYTDGHTYWNASHQVMLGSIDNLQGEVQAIIIVPFPLHPEKYYVFINTETGSFYSLVNTFGNGTIEILNQNLNIPIRSYNLMGFENDMITSIKHADGESYWVVIVGMDNIYSFKVGRDGIFQPVISHFQDIDFWHTQGKIISYQDTNGNNKILIPRTDYVISMDHSTGVAGLNILDFDTDTGQLINWALEPGCLSWPPILSIEISENNQYLYFLSNDVDNYSQDLNLLQADLNDIVSGGYTSPQVLQTLSVSNNNDIIKSEISRGMDGKIYFPHGNKMSVKNQPDAYNCDYQYGQYQFINGYKAYTLPQLVLKHQFICEPDLLIINEVHTGQIDNQASSNTITATNTIHNLATANYTAGNVVYLKPGFNAKTGSDFRAWIEGCFSTYTRPTINFENDESVLSKKQNDSKVMVYPNPADKNILINVDDKDFKTGYLSIYDMFGNLKLKKNIKITNNPIDINRLKAGLYILKVSSKDKIYKNVKLIVN